MSRARILQVVPFCAFCLVICCSPGTDGNSPTSSDPGGPVATEQAADLTLLSAWTLESISPVEVGSAVASTNLPLRVRSTWLKCQADALHALLEVPNLSDYLSSTAEPKIFFTLLLDTDNDSTTGSQRPDSGAEALTGFDWSLDFSTMQTRDESGTISSVLNCQVAAWQNDQFSGELGWGTRFNRSMGAAHEGEYAEFVVPRNVLPLCPFRGHLRVAFELPDSAYAQGVSRLVEYELGNT